MRRTVKSVVASFMLTLSASAAIAECGVASTYGEPQKTASGEQFNPSAMTAAHRSIRLGARVRVTYHGKSIIVRINDRGPYAKRRIIDLSTAAARALGLPGLGEVCVAQVS